MFYEFHTKICSKNIFHVKYKSHFGKLKDYIHKYDLVCNRKKNTNIVINDIYHP